MDLHDAVATRRTIQRFRADPVPEEVVERALTAAQWAPNHKTTWPWRFVLPGPKARQVLFRVGYRHKSAKKGASPELEAKVRADLLNPSHLVVVVQALADDPERRLEDHAACACAVQNLLLAVHADGYGAKWGTGATTRDPEALAELGVDPARERVVAFVWVGVPEIVPAAPARPPDRVTRLA